MKRTTLAVLAIVAMSAAGGLVAIGGGAGLPVGESGVASRARAAGPLSEAWTGSSGTRASPLPRQPLRQRATPGTPGYLAAEAPFLLGGAVDLDAFRRIIDSEAFEAQVERLENEMVQDAVASEARDAYAGAIRLQFEKLRLEPPLDRFACGRGLCMGSIDTLGTDAAYQAWWAEFQASAATPHDVGFDYTAQRPGGGQVHRFVFAHDPSIRSVSTRIRR